MSCRAGIGKIMDGPPSRATTGCGDRAPFFAFILVRRSAFGAQFLEELNRGQHRTAYQRRADIAGQVQ